MVDYYSILTRAVASLSPNTSEQRRDLYDRAHMTLVEKIRAVDPTLSDPALNAERAALEAAIQRVERDALRSAAPASTRSRAACPRLSGQAAIEGYAKTATHRRRSGWRSPHSPRWCGDLFLLAAQYRGPAEHLESANGDGRRRGTEWQIRLCQSAAVGVLPDKPACRDDHRR